MMAEGDGRYQRSVVTSNLQNPTSITTDPEHGYLFWADSGNNPKIERSWLDGSQRRTIVSTNIGHPVAISIDFAMGHMIYWADGKLQTIEMMDENGDNRHVVASGPSLKTPISVDVFEANMFWVNRDDGSVVQQDKFGRGVPVTLIKTLANPRSVKVLHPYRYNNSLHDPCSEKRCSHLCVIVPGKRNHPQARCQCPEGSYFTDRQQSMCDGAQNAPLAEPLVCKCRNGGVCRDDESCACEPDFSGNYCETEVRRIPTYGASTPAAVVVPVFLIVIILLVAAGVYFYYRKTRGT